MCIYPNLRDDEQHESERNETISDIKMTANTTWQPQQGNRKQMIRVLRGEDTDNAQI